MADFGQNSQTKTAVRELASPIASITAFNLIEASGALNSDTVEALIGAIFIDSKSSMSDVKNCISKIFAPELCEMEKRYHL
jgi:dsRNA-specific ribonuclease